MVEFKIEKDVEMPAGTRRHNLPLQEMEIGDSFLIPNGAISKASMHATLSRVKREGKGSYQTRSVAEGIRVWRVA